MKFPNQFDISILEPEFREFFEIPLRIADDLIESINTVSGINLKVHTYYSADRDIHVSISKSTKQNTYFLEISAAFPSLLLVFFNCLFHSDSFFSYLGKCEHNPNFQPFKDGLPVGFVKNKPLTKCIFDSYFETRPIDDARANAALEMAIIALSFLISHEIAHIDIGHVDANINLFNKKSFFEFYDKKRRIRECEIKQVWEYEADTTAMLMVLTNLKSKQYSDRLDNVFIIDSSSNAPLFDRGAIIACAIYGVFSIFFYRENIIETIRRTHPNPLVRFAYILEQMMIKLFKNKDYVGHEIMSNFTQKDLDDTLYIAAQMVHATCSELGLEQSFNVGNFKEYEKLFTDYFKLEENRKKYCSLYKEWGWEYPFKR